MSFWFFVDSGRIKVRISDALIFNFEQISYNLLVCKLTSIEIVSALDTFSRTYFASIEFFIDNFGQKFSAGIQN